MESKDEKATDDMINKMTNPDKGDHVGVKLDSGDVVEGNVQEVTAKEIWVQSANADRTIMITSTIPKANIAVMICETPQQRQVRAAYEALLKYRLSYSQGYTTDYYRAVIPLFEDFVSKYPSSRFTPQVQQFIADWKEEMSHAAAGHVKYRGRWYTPENAQFAYQQDLQKAQAGNSGGTARSGNYTESVYDPAGAARIRALPPGGESWSFGGFAPASINH